MSPVLLNAKQVLAEKGRTFYWASFLLSRKHADRATRLYGVCRYVDDLADEAASKTQAIDALTKVSAEIRVGFSTDATIQDGLELAKSCPFEPAILAHLVAGVRSDLDEVRMQGEADLIQYCYQVAGTVGLMMSKALDTHTPKAYPHAIDLGIAMQLTNICRDVKADALLGRCYLPKSLIGQIDLGLIAQPTTQVQDAIKPAIQRLLALADLYYASGEQGLAYLPLGARSAILLASRTYRAIGVQLAKQNYDYWTTRAVVTNSSKLRMSAVILVAMLFTKQFWFPNRNHNMFLHRFLSGYTGAHTDAQASHANHAKPKQ